MPPQRPAPKALGAVRVERLDATTLSPDDLAALTTFFTTYDSVARCAAANKLGFNHPDEREWETK